MNDQTLAELIRTRPDDGMCMFIEKHAGVIKWILAEMLNPADADDALNETLVRVWRSIANFDPNQAPLRAWAVVIAKRVALNIITHRRRYRDFIQFIERGERLEARARGDTLFEEKLSVAIRSLPTMPREVLEADLDAGGLVSATRIAAQLDINVGYVYVLRHRAYKGVREHIEEQDYGAA